MTTVAPIDFSRFLLIALFQKEVSLAVAKDEKELQGFKQMISEGGFKEAKNAFELLERAETPSKSYLVLDGLTDRELRDAHDLAIQYPTGQIELFDGGNMRPAVVSPSYQNTAIVFIVTNDELKEIQSKGLDLLSSAGLCYQSQSNGEI